MHDLSELQEALDWAREGVDLRLGQYCARPNAFHTASLVSQLSERHRQFLSGWLETAPLALDCQAAIRAGLQKSLKKSQENSRKLPAPPRRGQLATTGDLIPFPRSGKST